MLAKLKTYALVGIDAVTVEVEVDAAAGLPKTVILRTNRPPG
jgi:magnesium chelatase family protein